MSRRRTKIPSSTTPVGRIPFNSLVDHFREKIIQIRCGNCRVFAEEDMIFRFRKAPQGNGKVKELEFLHKRKGDISYSASAAISPYKPPRPISSLLAKNGDTPHPIQSRTGALSLPALEGTAVIIP